MAFTKISALWEASCYYTLLVPENIRSMHCSVSPRHNLCAIGPTKQRHVAYARCRTFDRRAHRQLSPRSVELFQGVKRFAAAALMVGHPTQATSLESTSATTTYHRVTVDGVGVFYREAGPKDAPTIVLLHGFPSSSREFDTLIPLLATRYHLIAPDFPGFGHSEAPPPSSYVYTFDNLAKTIDGLLEQLKIDKYTFFLHDYGGPVGFRIILAHPERLQALIIQNANVYEEGLGAKWAGIAQYWA